MQVVPLKKLLPFGRKRLNYSPISIFFLILFVLFFLTVSK